MQIAGLVDLFDVALAGDFDADSWGGGVKEEAPCCCCFGLEWMLTCSSSNSKQVEVSSADLESFEPEGRARAYEPAGNLAFVVLTHLFSPNACAGETGWR